MYIKQAYTGFNEGWKYLVGSLGIFFGSQFIGGIPFLIIVFMEMAEKGVKITEQSEMFALVEPNFLLFLMLLPFVLGFFMLLLWVKRLHKQSITSLTTSRSKISWKRIFFAFFLWAGITIILTIVDYKMNPQESLDFPRSFFFDGILQCEIGVSQGTRNELKKIGHDVEVCDLPLGGGQVIQFSSKGSVLIGGSDHRRDGSALGL